MTTSSTHKRDRITLSTESQRRRWGDQSVRHVPSSDTEPSNMFRHNRRNEVLRPTSEEAMPSQPGSGVSQRTGYEAEKFPDLQSYFDQGSRAAIPRTATGADILLVDPARSWPSWFSDMAEIQRHSVAVERRFENIPVESDEEGHDVPPDDVIEEARRIVHAMLRRWPREYDIYPMDDRRIAVEVDGGFGCRMLLLCEPGGTAVCIVTVDRVSRRARYEDSSILPDGFITDAFRDMWVRRLGRPLTVSFPSGVRGHSWPLVGSPRKRVWVEASSQSREADRARPRARFYRSAFAAGPMSVDRLDYADIHKLCSIHDCEAVLRSSVNAFYGWYAFTAELALRLSMTVQFKPTDKNPWHSEVSLPTHDGDELLTYWNALASESKWIGRESQLHPSVIQDIEDATAGLDV